MLDCLRRAWIPSFDKHSRASTEFVWIPALLGSTPSNWRLCGSLQQRINPAVSVDLFMFWINPFHVRLCGSLELADQDPDSVCGSPFAVDQPLSSIACVDRLLLWKISPSSKVLRLSTFHHNPWFPLRNGECSEAIFPSTALFSCN
jgi:hypothetical protein